MTRSVQLGLIGLILMTTGIVLAQQKEEPPNPQTPAQPAAAAPAKPASEFAYLRVYRQKRFTGSALAPSIYVDDKQIARVGNGRRFTMRLLPAPMPWIR
jgi:hypothetical protein